ncbi:MAG: hypothetical protein B6D34_00725 [Candidatus Brocadia sp. UTAMX1]|nr:MAG: hypothetical protein B6D34_00725 [Candidatus Brocadia sp. UTAMX1]
MKRGSQEKDVFRKNFQKSLRPPSLTEIQGDWFLPLERLVTVMQCSVSCITFHKIYTQANVIERSEATK